MTGDHDSCIMPNIRCAPECSACCTRLVNFGVRIGSTNILNEINLHLHCGELTVLIGPNGGGKTTLLRAMIGEIAHTGEMRFIPVASSVRQQAPKIGYVPQRLEIDRSTPITVLDLFAMARSPVPIWIGHTSKTREEARDALSRVQGEHLLLHKLGHLSCGQLQRVLLALALTPVPQLLLLDEPLAGIDKAGTRQFYEVVSQLREDFDLSILMVSHDIHEAAEIADRMVFVQQTIHCSGKPKDVLASPVVQGAFGILQADGSHAHSARHHDRPCLDAKKA